MYSKIIENLYLGEMTDVKLFVRNIPEGEILCVLPNRPLNEPSKAFQIPIEVEQDNIVRVPEEQLLHTFRFINRVLKEKNDLLVHCMAGQERSPLVVAFYLSNNFGLTLNDAYKKIKKIRPQTYDRSDWII